MSCAAGTLRVYRRRQRCTSRKQEGCRSRQQRGGSEKILDREKILDGDSCFLLPTKSLSSEASDEASAALLKSLHGFKDELEIEGKELGKAQPVPQRVSDEVVEEFDTCAAKQDDAAADAARVFLARIAHNKADLLLATGGPFKKVEASEARARHVSFDFEATEVHELIPYSEIYGLHPREFVFDRNFYVIPAPLGNFGFSDLLASVDEVDWPSDDSSDEAEEFCSSSASCSAASRQRMWI